MMTKRIFGLLVTAMLSSNLEAGRGTDKPIIPKKAVASVQVKEGQETSEAKDPRALDDQTCLHWGTVHGYSALPELRSKSIQWYCRVISY
mgnify:CR=1 FL=1